ncbi:M4 family metallopeptidase [Bacillus spongiae]|uniref:M4 family metallopeptidase n=1 Tax=Bacillus spongiae TaxID=2683610 RepID=A0ABU8HJ68_9BACI
MKKRKFVSTLLATSLSVGAFLTPTTISSVSANSVPETTSAEGNETLKQQSKLKKMIEKTTKAKKKLKISWDEKKGVPRYISGKLSDENADISAFLKENKDLFQIEDGEFKIVERETDELGMTHYRTQFTVDGIPVYGAELNVHTDQNGVVTSINGQAEPKLLNKKWSNSIKLSKENALEAAEEHLSLSPEEDTYTTEPKVDLYLYKHEEKWVPAYIVELQFLEPYIGRELIFIDAKKGDVLKSQNLIKHATETGPQTGTGTGVLGDSKSLNTYFDADKGSYYLIDTTKSMFNVDETAPILLDGVIRTYDSNEIWNTGSIVSDSDNIFEDKAAVDAHYYGGVVYDYFYDKHNRNSYDDKGSDIVSSVHVEKAWNNAAWVGTQMVYGDGDGITFSPLSGSLDVVAHELTHAVTDFSADLVYENESGALNESFSDVFGIIVEAENDTTDSVDWLLGEDVYTPNVAGDALRSMEDPTLYGQPDHMNDFVVLPNTADGDHGGVHTNSGIPNKAFYHIANAIDLKNTVAGEDVNLDKTGEIYYRALTKYLTSQSQFIDARNAILQATEDLYGADSEEYSAVADGFASVGIGSAADSNDTFEAAYQLTDDEVYTTTISSATDKDYYSFTSDVDGEITVNLTNLTVDVPVDYELYLYDSNKQLIETSVADEASNESIVLSTSEAGTYYVEVVGLDDTISESPYSITATFPENPEQADLVDKKWFDEMVEIRSPHPYPRNYNQVFTYSKPGVEKIKIHFVAIYTEQGSDFVYVKDKNGDVVATYDGINEDIWVEVEGDEVNIQLVSDRKRQLDGFLVDQVSYLHDSLILD